MKDRACSLGIIRRKEHKTQFCIPLSPVFTRDCGDGLNFMDEATASLDVENETLIQTALSRLIKDKTVLVIAHRMRTVSGADKVVVLSEGVAAEQGTPEELMQTGTIYPHMVKLQMNPSH